MMKKIKLTRANKKYYAESTRTYYYQQGALGHSCTRSWKANTENQCSPSQIKIMFLRRRNFPMRSTINQLRNDQLAKEQYTDAADDMLLKLF